MVVHDRLGKQVYDMASDDDVQSQTRRVHILIATDELYSNPLSLQDNSSRYEHAPSTITVHEPGRTDCG